MHNNNNNKKEIKRVPLYLMFSLGGNETSTHFHYILKTCCSKQKKDAIRGG